MKASGCAAAAASAENDILFVDKKSELSSFFWVLSNGFAPKTVDVALKIFGAVAAVIPPKMFVVAGAAVPPKTFVVVGAVVPPKMLAAVAAVVPPKIFVITGAVVPPKKFVVVAIVPPKMFVVVVEPPKGEALLPNVILEKGVELVLNTELED